MRWGLRKEARGRHALGAAVTAIPTAPPRPDEVPLLADQAWSERFPDALSDTQPVAVVVEAERAAVLPPVPVPPVRVVDPPVAVPQAVVPPPAAADPVTDLPRPDVRQLVPVQHLPVQLDVQPGLLDSSTSTAPPLQAALPVASLAPAPPAVPAPPPEPPSSDLLEGFAALAAFRPAVQAAVPTPAPAPVPVAPLQAVEPRPSLGPAGPRVEIGFADGTFRMLDPASSAARALSDLVAELTSKDPGPGATAS